MTPKLPQALNFAALVSRLKAQELTEEGLCGKIILLSIDNKSPMWYFCYAPYIEKI